MLVVLMLLAITSKDKISHTILWPLELNADILNRNYEYSRV